MTIKQQGGIFGRSPSFKDVEVENLTSTGETALQNLSTTNSPFNISASAADGSARLASNGFIGLGKDPSYAIDIAALADDNQLRISASNGGGQVALGVTQGQIAYVGSTNNVSLGLRVNGGDKWRIDTNGNLVVVNSGNGIDFSATAGTGTSELFDDYEEGTWTPAFDTSNGDLTSGYATQSGSYTKIGNVVNCHGALILSSVSGGTGTLVIKGLPYSASVLRAGSTGFVFNFATNYPKGYLLQSATSMGLYYEFSATTYSQMGPANLNADTQLYFFVSYLTA
jgi:hypothetical protein